MNVPVGKNIVDQSFDPYFDLALDDSDLAGLDDERIPFSGRFAEYREFLIFSADEQQNTRLVLQESSARSNSRVKDEGQVRLYTDFQSMYYVIGFDRAIDLRQASESDPLELSFLDEPLVITEVISISNSRSWEIAGTYRGLPFRVKDGDSFEHAEGADGTCRIGGDLPSDPDCWDWFIGNLNHNAATVIVNNASGVTLDGPYIGIRNDFAINDLDEVDSISRSLPFCLHFPNKFAGVCVDDVRVRQNN